MRFIIVFVLTPPTTTGATNSAKSTHQSKAPAITPYFLFDLFCAVFSFRCSYLKACVIFFAFVFEKYCQFIFADAIIQGILILLVFTISIIQSVDSIEIVNFQFSPIVLLHGIVISQAGIEGFGNDMIS